MFTVIFVMLSGLAAGYLLRGFPFLQKMNGPIYCTILFLLFVMGVHVGKDQNIINNLGGLGLQAFLISAACTLCSVIAAKFIYARFFKDLK